eukprot:CAMPEP_0177658754 /NCGR_PEP_ID=MMETSP0447-20121125/17024_1 /TAXON_ID=0 /ORGANISM="Stygamoeba regulata, Strain BSH-02190019" /LENGTH=182 /DNA_ID=CAMNT_0019163471 /DNA_START=13 /DNA_END=558 /DNA_ORIENTATION=-
MASPVSMSSCEMVSGGMKRSVSNTDVVSTSMPSSKHALDTADAVPAGASNSMPTIKPRPRMSLILNSGCCACMARRAEKSCADRFATLSNTRSSLKTSTTALAAAHATALPEYVPPWAAACQTAQGGSQATQREPVCNSLCKHKDVRRDVEGLAGKHGPSAPEARLDFIEDQQQAVLVAQLA